MMPEENSKKTEKNTQLNAQSHDKNFIDPVTGASWATWLGTILLRSIVTFFAMEFIRSWWQKFQDLYKTKEEGVDEQLDESVSGETKETES